VVRSAVVPPRVAVAACACPSAPRARSPNRLPRVVAFPPTPTPRCAVLRCILLKPVVVSRGGATGRLCGADAVCADLLLLALRVDACVPPRRAALPTTAPCYIVLLCAIAILPRVAICCGRRRCVDAACHRRRRCGVAELPASVEEMKAARIDIAYRDYCAHMLIDLNRCRHEHLYMPWACSHERHAYEKCEYIE
jgi:NADH dehydrogenase (ubiquinone) 1 beta subcomplex subunit 7